MKNSFTDLYELNRKTKTVKGPEANELYTQKLQKVLSLMSECQYDIIPMGNNFSIQLTHGNDTYSCHFPKRFEHIFKSFIS